MAHIRPRAAFVEWLNYIQSKIDFDEMEKDGKMELYFAAMQFVGEVAGNASYNHFFEEDIELMTYLYDAQEVTKLECANRLGISLPQINGRLNKLIKNGYLFYKEEKKQLYFILTPFGRKAIFEYILQGNDINETRSGK